MVCLEVFSADSKMHHAYENIKTVFLYLQFIADHVETNPLFKDNKDCQGLIMEALKYHLLPERRSSFQSPRTKPRKSTVGMMFAVGGMDSNKGTGFWSVFR